MFVSRSALILSLLATFACSSVSPDPVGEGDGADADVGDENTASCQGFGSQLIYVVDADYRLLSFDPNKIGSGDPYSVIGQLNCPAGAAWPDFGETAATPFSMSVDRQGTAWVLYSSGEIFKVSTTNAACTASNYQKGQKGFELFGMGFVSDAAGSEQETLFVAGGDAMQLSSGNLGIIDRDRLTLSERGAINAGESNPEMTGTGEGELYGFFPGFFENFIARLDKNTGAVGQRWDLEPLSGSVTAWAFAQWGGKFYMFVSTEGFLESASAVRVFDPATGTESVAVADSPYRVVGAGVSTCAPFVVE